MNWKLKSVLAASALVLTTEAAAQVTLYEREGFRGRAYATGSPVADLQRQGFRRPAASAIVDRGRWEVCDDTRYRGRCVVLRPGSYASLDRMGIRGQVVSMRPYDGRRRIDDAPAPLPEPVYEYRRRPNERLYEAPVTSVRAVMGQSGQRCWVERQQVSVEGRGNANVGGAIAGALIGGILGHQVGGGSGKDLATAGGAVAGAAIGANAGRDRERIEERDVRRCETVSNGPPDYWDVSYQFRGVEHHVQMSEPPGRTVTVNRQGLPRE